MKQTVWLVIVAAVGIAGFALLGFVQVQLAEGRRFKEQTPPRKRAIVCVSVAQWPYIVVAGYAGLSLVTMLR